MSFVADLVADLRRKGLTGPAQVKGCTAEEINALMEAQGVTSLPESYREFLECMGKDPYWLSQMGEWDYDWLLESKSLAREVVVEDYAGDFDGLEDIFVFQTHQGYMFYFFRGENLKDPDPRFYIFDGSRPIRLSDSTFNRWLSGLARYLPTELEMRNRNR
ncbi:SMI1/KNR4 family protein [Nocardia cyriacigeorgica]|uniref:Knr4/Smi1-like domain-containing protein n=1 Tax=Nocardia cyriacigeorgica (strain GUH-2) TaxID=1127134 RepID=H6R0W1_NOCCG|nr:SMI1/KNR4 family protein [Nocardia cyriacigeorgica]MBF6425640.1 SMI1/KNR4 family protein [Nocardia cyriacigeorgica]BDT85160.1 hypothetical protein FMUAM8_09240 [Nocardia cyriacigeorgica]CCF61735.1 protein of unknown function [Nocardia cyriacigeorgica GUH-2]